MTPDEPRCTPPQKLTDFRFVNLFSTEVFSAKGSHSWLFASRKKTPGADVQRPDAVLIIAVVDSEGQRRLVLTREFRAPLNAVEISVPSGLVDEGEDVVAAARRELREETGLLLDRVAWVSPATASSAGLTDETVAFVYAHASGQISAAGLEAHEHVHVQLVTIQEIQTLLRAPGGIIISSRLYPVLLSFATRGCIELPEMPPA